MYLILHLLTGKTRAKVVAIELPILGRLEKCGPTSLCRIRINDLLTRSGYVKTRRYFNMMTSFWMVLVAGKIEPYKKREREDL